MAMTTTPVPSAVVPCTVAPDFSNTLTASSAPATGSATVYSGTAPHGQGLDTAFAQIVADQLGITGVLGVIPFSWFF